MSLKPGPPFWLVDSVEQRKLPLASLAQISDADPNQSNPALVEPRAITQQVNSELFDEAD